MKTDNHKTYNFDVNNTSVVYPGTSNIQSSKKDVDDSYKRSVI